MDLADFVLARIAESTEYWQARRTREIDRQSIDRVLAGLEAQRLIVERVATLLPWGPPVLRLLALPYADHPAYREDWCS